MLSPGTYHLRVPRGPRENLKWRRHVLAECGRDARLRKALWLACSRDILFYVNTFVWQYNPRKKGESWKVGPFATWDFQDRAVRTILDCVAQDDDLLIEKSREMGASWLCLIVMEWCWHFHPWNKFLCISRSEKAVEDDDPDSLFWKIDFLHDHLPGWLMPKVKRRKLYFGNEDNGSTITGEASTGRAGVGGRATAMFIDEFSQIKEDYDVLHRTSDTTGCRIFNGTHCGTGTAFAELARRVDMRKQVMHWTQHPDKRPGLYRFLPAKGQVDVIDKSFCYPPGFDYVLSEAPSGGPHPGIRSPWYDRECLRKGSPRAVAMDLDIDAGGSVSQFFNPLTVRALKAEYGRAPNWEGDVTYDRDTGRAVGLVPLPGGPLKLWLNLAPDGRPPPSEYGAGADISAGQGATNSCLSLVDSRTGHKVCEYATATVLPNELAPVFTAVCWLFRDEGGAPARFAWEHQGPGQTFGKRVVEMGYRNIHYRQAHATLAAGKVSSVPGWFSSNDTKRALLEDYRAGLDSRMFVNPSEAALDECLEFRYTPEGNVEHSGEASRKDPTGARVNHGDRVIADALAWMMVRGKIGRRIDNAPPEEEVGSLAWRRMLAENDERQRAEAWY